MENPVIINNNVKGRESNQFLRFLNTLKRKERAKFIWTMVRECNVGRGVVYSWCYTAVRIPAWAKEIIEKEAGQQVFIKEEEDDTQQA